MHRRNELDPVLAAVGVQSWRMPQHSRAVWVADRVIWVLFAMIGSMIAGGCMADTPSTEPPAPSPPAGDTASAPNVRSFTKKVWMVAESQQVASGDLRVFLSNGRLVMASAFDTSTPAFGTWRYNDRRLPITEEGLSRYGTARNRSERMKFSSR